MIGLTAYEHENTETLNLIFSRIIMILTAPELDIY